MKTADQKSVTPISKIGVLTYRSNWNGGEMLLEGKNIRKGSDLPPQFFAKFKGKYLPCRLKTISGVDHDHGHQYSWTNYDFILTVDSDLGKIEVSFRSLLQAGKVKSLRLYQDQ